LFVLKITEAEIQELFFSPALVADFAMPLGFSHTHAQTHKQMHQHWQPDKL